MNLLSVNMDVIPNVRLVGHVDYIKPWIHFNRTIDEYILYIIKSGELYIKEGEIEYTLRKGDYLFLEPNIVHEGFKASCCHYFYIHFKHNGVSRVIDKSFEEISDEMILTRKLSLTSDIFSEHISSPSTYFFPKLYHYENESELFSLLMDANDNFYQKYENYKRYASLKLWELMILICRQYTSTKIDTTQAHFSKAFVKCRDILNYLEKEYPNKITSTDIENIFESNYDYLNRVFQKMTGYTIFNYLNLLRIRAAMELIDKTQIKFSEIGYLVGINDPYYFSKLFKKYAGMTPTQYLKRKNTAL